MITLLWLLFIFLIVSMIFGGFSYLFEGFASLRYGSIPHGLMCLFFGMFYLLIVIVSVSFLFNNI